MKRNIRKKSSKVNKWIKSAPRRGKDERQRQQQNNSRIYRLPKLLGFKFQVLFLFFAPATWCDYCLEFYIPFERCRPLTRSHPLGRERRIIYTEKIIQIFAQLFFHSQSCPTSSSAAVGFGYVSHSILMWRNCRAFSERRPWECKSIIISICRARHLPLNIVVGGMGKSAIWRRYNVYVSVFCQCFDKKRRERNIFLRCVIVSILDIFHFSQLLMLMEGFFPFSFSHVVQLWNPPPV